MDDRKLLSQKSKTRPHRTLLKTLCDALKNPYKYTKTATLIARHTKTAFLLL